MHRGIIDTDLRRRAWSAMGLLALFVVAYLGLTGWFAVTGARLVTSAFHGGRSAGESFFAGVCELLFALFMAKGLFFRRTVARQGCLEITPAGQPRLIAASEGATEGDLAALDHLAPEEGLTIPLALSGLGLAHRRGLPEAPLRDWLAGQGLDAASAPLRFFDALVAHRPTAEVEATLTGAPLEVRGLAVTMGVVALGPAAPEDWRLQARTILFGYERPFLAKP